MTRGYYGVGVYQPKNQINIGTLWRSAQILNASFLFTIGRRYKPQSSDTMKTWRHLPIYNYQTFDSFKDNLPFDCMLVAVEINDCAIDLSRFKHPDRCVYLLGAEDTGIPQQVLDKCHRIVRLRGDFCLNVATAGSIVMYHREEQIGLKGEK